MGSFKGNKRNQGPHPRRNGKGQSRQYPALESLEERTLLDGGGGNQTAPTWKPTSNVLTDVQNGPMANAGQYLISIYSEYENFLSTHVGGTFTSKYANQIDFKNDTEVGINVRGWGNFSTFVSSLRNVGMQIDGTDSPTETVDGFLPIAQLPSVARMTQTVGLSPIFDPVARSVGKATNQSELTLNAVTARNNFKVDGTGVMVGVLSDSVNQFQGGISDSVKTGDLPSNILIPIDTTTGLPEDGPAGSTDEGRAMLEQVHDIAPGASLAFATADGGDAAFAQHIRDLAKAGAKVIVDDIGYFDEPFFQDGIISQAVASVTAQGATYLSAAGNSADSGYSSVFRGVQANVTGVGTGRFMNFDPGGGTTTNLPITVTQPNAPIMFEFDQPFYTSTGVTSNVQIFVLDSTGTVVASGTTNTIATQQPLQNLTIPSPGNYTVAIQVVSGPDPGRIQFLDPSSNDFTVSHQFGTAGGTFYPSTYGHPAASSAIGVGAVPWWNAQPWTNPATVTSEGFSSFGPQIFEFNPDGSKMAQPQTRLKPDVSAPDGNDTSFFVPNQFLATKNPPPGTGPATSTELDGNTNPNFFGTSSATPNLAAVVALMDQFSPGISGGQVLSAFITSTTPLNGAAPGSWNTQGGFGLVDANKALASVDKLRVVATAPSNGAVLSSAPSSVIVSFSKPINPATLNASELSFTATPPGVTATPAPGLTPIIINASTVAFPIDIESLPNVSANGAYTFTIKGPILATTGQALVPFSASFSLSDTIAPRVSNVVLNGRVIAIQFTEAMRPSTINRNNILLIRTGSSGVFNNPTNVLLNNDPRMIVFYDAVNNRAIIDLTQLPQSELPSDHYGIVVLDKATDQAGNKLDGEFTGVYPSGNGLAGGSFFLDLPSQQVEVPLITSLRLSEPGDVDSNGNPLPVTDTGIPNDQNTNNQAPIFVGTVSNLFPGTAAGLQIVAQFNGLNNGVLDLGVGAGGRGFSGTVGPSYAFAVTDATGHFVLRAPGLLPNGYNTLRVVVIGQPDAPPLPGLSSLRDVNFRVDTTTPFVLSTSLPANATINALTTLSLNVADPVLPVSPTSPLAVPTQLSIPALDPRTADNLSNYSLINAGPDGVFGTPDDRDESTFITGANFVSTTIRANTNDPFTGRIDLSFAPGLPPGRYELVAHTVGTALGGGITDGAANPLDGNPALPGLQDFVLPLNLQPVPVFITQLQMVSPTPTPGGPSTSVYGPRSFFEIPSPGNSPDAPAPPTQILIDFSNPLDPNRSYNNVVQVIRSANTAAAQPDGDFGVDGVTGFTLVQGVTIQLVNSVPGAVFGQPGFLNRLVVNLPPNLPADHYRILLPNTGGTSIFDIFGNQLDGEFLGNPTTQGSLPNNINPPTPAPEPPIQYEDLLPNGQNRAGLSGDGLPGGSFETSFIVTPPVATVIQNGVPTVVRNVIYARPDANDNADGSIQNPFPALAPEAIPNAFNNGDLNSSLNAGTGFDPSFDRNANGHFDPSAVFAAQLAATRGPVVIVALPGILTNTGQSSFVIQAPAGNDPLKNDASISVPFDTAMVFAPGSAVKLLNASIFVQNQGTSLMVLGGPNPSNVVNFTSFNDDSVGGPSRPPGNNVSPNGGDWGGIVPRNYDQKDHVNLVPFPVDGTLKGEGGLNPQRPAISGADDALTMFNFARIQFAGGSVAQTAGPPFDAITAFNARPLIANTLIANTGGIGGSQAAISGDLDSFREDQLTRGMLVRQTTVLNNSLNGIWVRPELTGQAEQTNAMFYPDNPSTLGGTRNFVFDSPLPYILTSQLFIGTSLNLDNDQITNTANRVYIQPGMMFKLQHGAGIDVLSAGSSLNVGDRTYINEWDLNHNLSPNDPGFRAPTVGDARVLFTSLFDDNATTSFFDPNTNQTTTIVSALDSDNQGPVNVPTPGNVPFAAEWGSVMVQSGALSVIDEAQFQYGGGPTNSQNQTIPDQSVLSFTTFDGLNFNAFNGLLGTHAYISNNNFFDNFDTPMQIEPDGLAAADPLRPLTSGNPFFRGNLMQRNTINGMAVVTSRLYQVIDPATSQTRPVEGIIVPPGSNLDVDSVWDDTDLTYVLRGTIVAGGFQNFPLPHPADPNVFTAEPKPSIVLTLQSAAPGQLLADGSHIGKPGESLLVKTLNDFAPLGDGVNGSHGVGRFEDTQGGAGFIFGVDNNVDPTTDPLIDPGANSQLRIVGIGGNETLGQARVPVIITSLHDNTVGTTIHGVKMFQAITGDTKAPSAGDGGIIYFGGNTLTDYNLWDPRDGNIIDNADIKFLTRIEMSGGGIIDVQDINADSGFGADDNPLTQKLGLTPALQYNQAKAMTISNSNLSDFSQAGFIGHPGYNAIDFALNFAQTPNPARSGILGEPIDVFFVNNTIANMPVGVRVFAENANDQAANGPSPSPEMVTLLNNTFFNDAVGLQTQAPTFNGQNSQSHVDFLAMDNIFDQSSTAGIQTNGQIWGSEAQYNLFNANGQNTSITGEAPYLFQNVGAQIGDPQFLNAAAGDFRIGPNSAAIDASRSEIGPLPSGDALLPIADQQLNATGGIRNNTGRSNAFGGNGFVTNPQDIVTLPGWALRTFADQFLAVPAGTPGSVPGLSNDGGATYSWLRLTGQAQHDQLGFLRQDDPARANIGFGSRLFFDIGAFEFRQFFPPHVVTNPATGLGIAATVADSTSPTGSRTVDLYVPNGIGGVNKPIQTITLTFDETLDPNTVNNQTVILQEAGGDGIFGNANSTLDKSIDLSGKLAFDPIKHTLTINLQGLNLPSDQYRITLLGNGSNVIRDQSGNALDGENTKSDDPNNPQQPLPSGDGFPGGNFFLNFTVDTHPPAVVSGSVILDPASDSGVRDGITNNANPTFDGIITDLPPPSPGGVGETVVIDISTKGNGVFDRLNAGTAVTTPVFDVQGNIIPNEGQFKVTISGAALPDSPIKIGKSGKEVLFGGDLTGFSVARIRVIDPSGNSSNPNDFGAMSAFVIDTKGPKVTASSLQPNAQANPVNNQVTIQLTVNKNLDPNSVNTSTVRVTRSGGDGVFGNANDVSVPVSNITLSPPSPFSGSETLTVTFGGTALPNDLYRLTLAGTGGSTVTDIAANPVDGEFTGAFPSGDGKAGGDFNLPFVIFNPALSKLVYAGASTFATNPAAPQGSRANPFPTIGAAITKANIGDTVAVLPGVYQEMVILKSFVRVVSADPSSSDVALLPGNALQTIISPQVLPNVPLVGVVGVNLASSGLLNTELSGFTIADPLQGDPSFGPITPKSIGILLFDANVLIDKNFIIDAEMGIDALTAGFNASTPRIQSNVVAGNVQGIVLNDMGVTTSLAAPFQVVNNDILYNTAGMLEFDTSPGVGLFSTVDNNIFWQNNSGGVGSALMAATPNKTLFRSNMIGSGNGPIGAQTFNIGGGFNPATLSSTSPDALGNFLGEPNFVAPRDPRPTGDGPAIFLTDANFDLTFASAAIDNALQTSAPPTDLLNRGRVEITGKGFPGRGPADVGAFEFMGSGGSSVGGAFRVVTSSLVPSGASSGTPRVFGAAGSAAGGAVTISFSHRMDQSSVTPNDLILSGTAIDPINPPHAVSLNWVDDHTVQFQLAGTFRSSGAVKLDIPAGAVLDSNEQPMPEFSNIVVLNSTSSSTPTGGTSGGMVTRSAGGASPTKGSGSVATQSTPSAPAAAPVVVPTNVVANQGLATPAPAASPLPASGVKTSSNSRMSLRGLFTAFRRSRPRG